MSDITPTANRTLCKVDVLLAVMSAVALPADAAAAELCDAAQDCATVWNDVYSAPAANSHNVLARARKYCTPHAAQDLLQAIEHFPSEHLTSGWAECMLTAQGHARYLVQLAY